MRDMFLRAHAALLLLVPLLALAQEPAGPQSATPLYEVEIIAFRHLDQRGSTRETEPGADALARGEAGAAAAPGGIATGYPPLTPQSLRLGGIAAKLRRGGAYELLYHGGWIQGVARQNQALPTPVPPPGTADAGVSGSITLYRERYLHALLDVAFRRDSAQGARIRQGRRLRGQGVHYFDHPQFGVILAVRPVNGPATAGSADEAPPP